MSEGRIIRELLKSHVHHDEEGFRRAAKDLIQRERSLNHRLLADDLERILCNGTSTNALKLSLPWEVPKDKDKGFPLLTVARPEIPWERLVLPPAVMHQLESI